MSALEPKPPPAPPTIGYSSLQGLRVRPDGVVELVFPGGLSIPIPADSFPAAPRRLQWVREDTKQVVAQVLGWSAASAGHTLLNVGVAGPGGLGGADLDCEFDAPSAPASARLRASVNAGDAQHIEERIILDSLAQSHFLQGTQEPAAAGRSMGGITFITGTGAAFADRVLTHSWNTARSVAFLGAYYGPGSTFGGDTVLFGVAASTANTITARGFTRLGGAIPAGQVAAFTWLIWEV